MTVADIENLARELREKRAQVEELEKPLKVANKELSELEAKIVGALKEIGKDSYKSEYGTITQVKKWRVNLPSGPEEKAKFFEFLKKEGLFEQMTTVNSQTLNSFFMERWEQLKKEDPVGALNFSIPGIGEPKVFETLSFRKK